MENVNNGKEPQTITFDGFKCEYGNYYAIYTSPEGIKFKVTPVDQTSNGHLYVDLVSHIRRQRAFSIKTFGPIGQGQKPEGVIAHMLKEIREELSLDPTNLKEWVDMLILSIDGCIKSGHSPQDIVMALLEKQTKNESRKWPDWRTMPKEEAIEHIRTAEEQVIKADEVATSSQIHLNFDGNGTPLND
jgi:hypothetical protein